MYVTRYMSTPPVTVGQDRPLGEARRTLEAGRFRHLPVVDDRGRLVGILSDRDMRSSGPSDLSPEKERRRLLGSIEDLPVREVMTAAPRCLSLSSTLDDALDIFEREKIGALPVIDGEGKVAGVFSVQDLLEAFRRLFGLGESGSVLIEIEDDGRPDLMTAVVSALDDMSVPLCRMIRVPGEKGGTPSVLYARVHTYNLHALHKALSARGLKTRLDSPENVRDRR